MRKRTIWRRAAVLLILIIVASAATAFGRHQVYADWRTASRESVGIAPDPAKVSEAVVQVYGARAYNWRGYFGVHTWISVKPKDARSFDVYEVIGWRVRRGGNAVSVSKRPPDGRWFGAPPELLADVRGPRAEDMIGRIAAAAESYPYKNAYTVWPGPNSNTFVAYVARAVPELRLDLPPTAIGKDYLPDGGVVAPTPSGTGYQFSLFGLLGVLAGAEEGIEINLLGLTFGVDILDPAIKLPLAGRLGVSDVNGDAVKDGVRG